MIIDFNKYNSASKSISRRDRDEAWNCTIFRDRDEIKMKLTKSRVQPYTYPKWEPYYDFTYTLFLSRSLLEDICWVTKNGINIDNKLEMQKQMVVMWKLKLDAD